MADAYGAIVAGYSEDFEGDIKQIKAVLNALDISNDGSQFVVNENNELWLRPGFSESQYPTVRPCKPHIVVVDKNNLLEEKRYEDVDITSEDICGVVEEKEIALESLSKMIAEHIVRGQLHLSCCSNEKQRSVDSKFLSVSADGSARSVSISQWVGERAFVVLEEYDGQSETLRTQTISN